MYGLDFRTSHHSSRFGRVGAYRNTHHVTVSGKHGFLIEQLNTEQPGQGQTDARNSWQTLVSDVDDPKNLGAADINYWVVVGGVGAVNQFTINGGAGIRARRIGSAPAGNGKTVEPPAAAETQNKVPTFSEVRYGSHPRNVLDFWKADSATPTPWVFVIHGGGWEAASKEAVHDNTLDLRKLLSAGISVVSINYRYTRMAKAEGMEPPVKGPMLDSARALQFVRSKANEWNLDKQRVGAAGGSAGGCSSLWLAYHADLADPKSSDPVARESTRLFCVAVKAPQTTLDPKQMKEWTPNSTYGGHAFGFETFDKFLAGRDTILPWIKEYSPYELVSAGDPPVYLFYLTPPALGKAEKDPTHSANFGLKLQEQCVSNKVPCELVYPGAPDVKHPTLTDYLIATLKTDLKKP
jgi:acetyl esterase/lipase